MSIDTVVLGHTWIFTSSVTVFVLCWWGWVIVAEVIWPAKPNASSVSGFLRKELGPLVQTSELESNFLDSGM